MTGVVAWKGHAVLGLAARVYLAFVFLFACVHKIIVPESFAVDIATYEILPIVLVNPMAVVLPYVEAAAGLLLLLGWRTRGSALLVCLMMLVFTVAVSIALGGGLNMSCGCFASQGAVDDPISWKTILRDSGWLLLSAYVCIFDEGRFGVDGILQRRRRQKSPQKENKEDR